MLAYPNDPKVLVAVLVDEYDYFCKLQYDGSKDVLKSVIPDTIKQYQEGFISWHQVLQIAKGVVK